MHETTTTPKFEHVFEEEDALVKCDFPSIGTCSVTPQSQKGRNLKPQARAL